MADAREETIANGAVYGEEDDILALYQTASGAVQTEYAWYSCAVQHGRYGVQLFHQHSGAV